MVYVMITILLLCMHTYVNCIIKKMHVRMKCITAVNSVSILCLWNIQLTFDWYWIEPSKEHSSESEQKAGNSPGIFDFFFRKLSQISNQQSQQEWTLVGNLTN